MTAICKSLRVDISSMCESMTDKSNNLEGQSRQNNMVVDGIAESPHETWMESEDKVREIISEKLKMDSKKIELERAHRTGKPTTGPGDRPVVVKFLRFIAHTVYRLFYCVIDCTFVYPMCNSVCRTALLLSWPGRSCKLELVLNWPTCLNKGEIIQIKKDDLDKY